MAERNPFLDSDDPRPSVAAPQVPISGNPFLPAPANAAPPSTALGDAADFAKAASNTFTFGMRDRMEGVQRALQGDAPGYSAGVDQAVADSAMRRERSPYLSVAGDVAGGTAQAFVPGAGAIGRGTAAALGGAAKGLPGVAARMAGYGIEGGVLGGAQAAGHTYTGNPEDYARNATVGGAFGAVLGAPFGKYADVAPRNTAPVPDAARLKQSTSQRYGDTHSVPIDYHTDQFRGAMDALEKRLYGITDPDKSKTVWHTINDARSGRLQADPNAPTVTPKDIDALRQKLTGVNEVGARQTRDFLDRFMASPIAQASGGDAQRNRVTQLITDARGDYRAAKRTETVENTNQYADDRFHTANSAQNAGNTYKQKLVALLHPKSREGKWYNPSEKADIRDVTSHEGVAEALRTGGNYARGIGGLTAGGGGVAASLATGDLTPLLGLAIPAAGAAMKGVSNRMTVNHARELEGKMAMRSPLYREWAAQSPVVAGPGLNNFAESSRNAVTNQVLEQLRLRGVMDAPVE